jgi:DnaJ family protein C protein 27
MSQKRGTKKPGRGLPTEPVPINRIKILSMGSGGCGKSCLIKRYCEERFVSKYIATIGVDYGVKPVNIAGNDTRVNFWDLSGHQEVCELPFQLSEQNMTKE